MDRSNLGLSTDGEWRRVWVIMSRLGADYSPSNLNLVSDRGELLPNMEGEPVALLSHHS